MTPTLLAAFVNIIRAIPYSAFRNKAGIHTHQQTNLANMKSPLIHLHAVGIVLLALMPLSAHGQTVSWVLLEILITGRERE